MLMKNSVEGRFPYLDHRVIEYANSLHPNCKMPGLNEKRILKDVFISKLPQEIVQRPKQPYRVQSKWQGEGAPLQRLARFFLSEEKLTQSGYFDVQALGKLLDKSQRSASVSFREENALTLALTTQIWHESFCIDTL